MKKKSWLEQTNRVKSWNVFIGINQQVLINYKRLSMLVSFFTRLNLESRNKVWISRFLYMRRTMSWFKCCGRVIMKGIKFLRGSSLMALTCSWKWHANTCCQVASSGIRSDTAKKKMQAHAMVRRCQVEMDKWEGNPFPRMAALDNWGKWLPSFTSSQIHANLSLVFWRKMKATLCLSLGQ